MVGEEGSFLFVLACQDHYSWKSANVTEQREFVGRPSPHPQSQGRSYCFIA